MLNPIALHKRLSRRLGIGILLLLPALVSLACSMSLGSPGSQETQMAVALQSTYLTGKEVTLAAQQTQAAQNPTPQDTPTPVPLPTDTPVPTPSSGPELVAPTQTPASSPESSPTSAPASETITLTMWKLSGFVGGFTDCLNPNEPCWGQVASTSAAMTSEQDIYIDPAWKNPYLLFVHKYTFPFGKGYDGKLIGYIRFSIEGRWRVFRIFNGSKPWTPEQLSLEEYKGQTITVQFSTELEGWSLKGDKYWYIQNVQIVPNFTSP
ncbi:MAG: hypothetical protein AB1894_11780 [Chloroflexota bacterium]